MRRSLIRCFGLLLSLALLGTLFSAPVTGADAIRLFVGERELFPDVAPIVEAGRTLVPLRAVAEAIGGTVQWDQATQTITIATGGAVELDKAAKTVTINRAHTVTMTIGSTAATVDGQAKTLEVAPKVVEGRTVVPVRFVAEAFGFVVQWDGELRAVRLNSPAESPLAIEALEVVAAAVGPHNEGTGNQTRIVRTNQGVFTSYILPDGTYRVDQRTPAGWVTVSKAGTSKGNEAPVIVRTPDETVYYFDWPDGNLRMWSKPPAKAEATSGWTSLNWYRTDWPAASAGISPDGEIYLMSTLGYDAPTGRLQWASYDTRTGQWGALHNEEITKHHDRMYLLPGNNHAFTFTASRTTKWENLGLTKPAGYWNDNLQNLLSMWSTPNSASVPLTGAVVHEEKVTEKYGTPWTTNDNAGDSYIDMKGRLHVVYLVQGESTEGAWVMHHAIYETNGQLLKDVYTPIGGAKMIQDTQGAFYYFCWDERTALTVYKATDEYGLEVGDPVKLSLQGYKMGYSTIYLAAPRSGTPLADYVDGVFQTDEPTPKWVYVRIRLR